MYFESHAHYDDKRFDKDREKLLKQLLPESGVETVINIGADMNSSYKSVKLAEKYPYFYAAVGVHPHDAASMSDQDLETLHALSNHRKVVAIGEIGLDFYYDNSPRNLQRFWFQKQLSLAKETNLPVVIHSREAAQECFNMIKSSGVRRGVIHCYSGSAQMALDYIKMGFYIGIGGTLTYQNAKKTVEVVEAIPLEKILLETDSPYLSPVPKRGERNDSRNLVYVAEKIADIKKISHSQVTDITKENANNLFFK